MENKNILLGLLAFVLAVGSGFSSKTAYQSAWVKVLYYGNLDYRCEDTGFYCDQNGPLTCKIYVETMVGLVVTPGRSYGACVYTLNENSNVPIGVFTPPGGIVITAK